MCLTFKIFLKFSLAKNLAMPPVLVAVLPTLGRHTDKILADCLLKITDHTKITGCVSQSIISPAIDIDCFDRYRMLPLIIPLTCNP